MPSAWWACGSTHTGGASAPAALAPSSIDRCSRAISFVLHLPEQRERPILTTPGVARLLRYPQDDTGYAAPKLLGAEVVDEIRRRCDAGEFDQVEPATPGKLPIRRDLKAGDQVRTVAGAVAELRDLDDSGRAMLLMTWFNQRMPTRVADARGLELAATGD